MIENMSFNINETNWVRFEKGNAKNIDSKNMDPTGIIKKFTISLMRVRPGGEFPPHTDSYSHFFYVISGTGEGLLGEEVYKMESGHIAIVKAGERHGYRNIGKEDMYLLTMNIP